MPKDDPNTFADESALEKAGRGQNVDESLHRLPKVNRFFRNTAFGRTLSLRNKTGKLIATGAVGIGSSFIPGPLGGWVSKAANALIATQTGVPMGLFDGLSLLQIIITVVAFLVVTVVPIVFPRIKKLAVWETIEGRLDDVADEVVKAIDEDSEGGKSITRNEIKAIVSSALKKEDQ